MRKQLLQNYNSLQAKQLIIYMSDVFLFAFCGSPFFLRLSKGPQDFVACSIAARPHAEELMRGRLVARLIFL